MNRRSGFTIVEMLVVIAVLAILMGIVGMAATSAIRNARGRLADAMKQAWQGAINAYYAQKGEWPGSIESAAENSSETLVDLSDSEINAVFQEIATESINKANPFIDVSALYVCRNSSVKGCNDLHDENCPHKDQSANAKSGCSKVHYCGNLNCASGMDFNDARAKGVSISSMAFGYPGKKFGKFRRFYIRYNTQTDTVTVGTR